MPGHIATTIAHKGPRAIVANLTPSGQIVCTSALMPSQYLYNSVYSIICRCILMTSVKQTIIQLKLQVPMKGLIVVN